jgi:hypothetical protein
LVARWLWRSWTVVELGLVVGVVPEQTRRRWQARLASQARSVVAALAASAQPALERVAATVGLNATRRALVAHCRQPLDAIAALVHRLIPGLRLM